MQTSFKNEEYVDGSLCDTNTNQVLTLGVKMDGKIVNNVIQLKTTLSKDVGPAVSA